jgi:Transposase DDE domain.
MPHQGQGRSACRPAVFAALDWLVKPEAFACLSFRKECRWTPASLVQATLLWAWSEEASLVDRFVTAQQVIAQGADGQRESVSYQAFVKLLRRHTAVLLAAVIAALQRAVRESLSDCYRVAGYLAFAVDGTRIDVPRTAANEQAFAAKRRRSRQRGRRRRAAQKKAAVPQAALTTLWHLGSGLPWNWTHGPRRQGERSHMLAMLPALPEQSLLLADAGFVGYDFWQALLEAGHDFVIRVGANVALLKRLGYSRECAGRVYLWPDRQSQRSQPPLVLRLVVAHGGKHPVYLVSSVLAQSRLSDRRLIELYRARWGVEVFFRSFKRTFGRHKLRSASPANAELELDWSLVALWAACLYAKRQQAQAGEDVARTSVAGVMRILRQAVRRTQVNVSQLLAVALVDAYTRTNKTSRDYPRKKTDGPNASPPKIVKSSQKQIMIARQIKG